MDFNFENLKVQGVKFNYYFICKRKLWLFSNGISMENNSERVTLGKLIHEKAYKKKEHNKEKLIDGIIKLDILDKEFISEIKITSKMEKSDKYQLLYYLYYLKQMGIYRKGKLNYVKEKKVVEVNLTAKDECFIEETLIAIQKVLELDKPVKVQNYLYCKKCAYYEFCYIKE